MTKRGEPGSVVYVADECAVEGGAVVFRSGGVVTHVLAPGAYDEVSLCVDDWQTGARQDE